MNRITIHNLQQNKLNKITHYNLSNGETIFFNENEGQIDLNPLRPFIGQELDEFVNGEYYATRRLLDVYTKIMKDGKEVLAIKMTR